ncbi:unnamed protein product [Fraxinus pennsylvanica]|uniref:ATP-dependent DNA helicase n=1 Tax=Fraxinus pennsylvanica TaxID=56036 RepID=A0AAD2DI70_9LAMI|nr:unnamed protein product [Fraxinus pennsylvanica]
MKLFSYAISICRCYSSKASSFNQTKWGGNDTPKRPRIKWTNEQKRVLDAISNGKSVFITGSAGTGKTFVLEHAIKRLKKIHGRSNVYVTASTGVAALSLGGQTLHSFAGVGIGDADRASLVERILSNKRAHRRWKKVKALVIDEASMIDNELFESLESIARFFRNEEGVCENKIWGGIQLVVSGDFFQLPPVLKNKKKDAKKYAFEADCWNASFDMQIELTKAFRQLKDETLIRILLGIRKGECDPGDLNFLEGCCSGDEPDPSAVRLYPRTEDVNKVNKMKMESLKENIVVFRAVDLGEDPWKRQLKHGIAPDELELCKGARVMLTKNKNPWLKLVNGATGTVKDFVEASDEQCKKYKTWDGDDFSIFPVVEFDCGIEMKVEPEIWAVMDGDKVVAKRRQIPLILSWALSIHKCQGMTLDKLHTDLKRVFDFGMVYVALSRVRLLTGLHLSGLDPSKIKAHPKVLQFYSKFSGEQDGQGEDSIADKN